MSQKRKGATKNTGQSLALAKARGLSWVRALLFRGEGAIFDSLAYLCDSLTQVQELFHDKCQDCNENGKQ